MYYGDVAVPLSLDEVLELFDINRIVFVSFEKSSFQKPVGQSPPVGKPIFVIL